MFEKISQSFKNNPLAWGLVFLTLCLYVFLIGDRPLANPDEGRYVEIPREMLATGDFLTPRLNALKYFEKPVLFYWMQAGILKVAGVQEGLLRFWPCLGALLFAFGFYRFLKRREGETLSLWTVSILVTTPFYFWFSRMIILDMVFSVFVCAALLCFFEGYFTPEKRRWYFYAFTTFIGLGILTKGLAALVLTGPVIVVFLTLQENGWKNLRPLYLPTNLVLLAAIVLPWHILVSLENPDFFYKYVIFEHFLRYTTTVHKRYQPFWFFIPIIFVGLFTWVSLLPQSLKNLRTTLKNPFGVYCGLWFSWVFLFFSFSSSKLIPYILPAFPPLCYLIAKGLSKDYEEEKPLNRLYPSLWFLALALVGTIVVFKTPEFINLKPEVMPYISDLTQFMFVAAAGVWAFKSLKTWVSLTTVLNILCLATIVPSAKYIQKTSTKNLAQVIKSYEQDVSQVRVGCFRTYLQDLPVYLGSTIYVIDYEGELDFGVRAESSHPYWMLDTVKWVHLWRQPERYYLILRTGELDNLMQLYPDVDYYKLAEEDDFLLVTNSAPAS